MTEPNAPMNIEMDFQAAVEQAAPGLVDKAAMIARQGESVIDSIARAAQTYYMADAQRRLLDVQLERARRGQAPLSASEWGMGVSLGIDTKTVLMLGGAILVAALILRRR